MRRAGRWTLNALVVVSLLLCVATCVLWVRSYRNRDNLIWTHQWLKFDGASPEPQRFEDNRLHVESSGGQLAIGWQWTSQPFRPLFDGLAEYRRLQPPAYEWSAAVWQEPWTGGPPQKTPWQRAGFAIGGIDEHDGLARLTILWIPHWAATLTTGLPPSIRLVRAWRRRRARQRPSRGHCPTCRYDLTANVSGVCPECGTATAKEVV